MSEYVTRDSRIAGFLAHLNIEHVKTLRSSDKKGFKFFFKDECDECRAIVNNLFAGAGTSDALSLLDAYRAINATIRHAEEHGVWTNKD